MSGILSDQQKDDFIRKGFLKIENAFSAEDANAVLDILWADIPFDRNDAGTWTEPVIRLGMYNSDPFVRSVNGDYLHQMFDELVGKGKWLPCRSVGTFPVRFPSAKMPPDTGKHVDAGFPGTDLSNYFEWRINLHSKGRALLMLVLYTDVAEQDAPTVIYEGSHFDVARLLADKGPDGLSFLELAQQLDALSGHKKTFAVGKAGTVYLCHPFIVHAAQAHYGEQPKFMAQPPLLLKNELNIDEQKGMLFPVEKAIQLALRK
ncbi:MAG: hypothetical protein ABW007_22690 [Chitinophagaceae bacterium]